MQIANYELLEGQDLKQSEGMVNSHNPQIGIFTNFCSSNIWAGPPNF